MDTAYIDRRIDAISIQHVRQNDQDDLAKSVYTVITVAKDRTPNYNGSRYRWHCYRGMIKIK